MTQKIDTEAFINAALKLLEKYSVSSITFSEIIKGESKMRIKFDDKGKITIEALNSKIETESVSDAAEKIGKIKTGVIYLGPENVLDKDQLDDFRLCYELGELMFSVIGGKGKDFDSARELKFQLVKMSALSELRGNS